MSELLPCPHCTGEAQIRESTDADGFTRYTVACICLERWVRKESAIAAWNRRASAPAEKKDQPSDYEKWFYENSLNRG